MEMFFPITLNIIPNSSPQISQISWCVDFQAFKENQNKWCSKKQSIVLSLKVKTILQNILFNFFQHKMVAKTKCLI